jgi:hypothetical protein
MLSSIREFQTAWKIFVTIKRLQEEKHGAAKGNGTSRIKSFEEFANHRGRFQ